MGWSGCGGRSPSHLHPEQFSEVEEAIDAIGADEVGAAVDEQPLRRAGSEIVPQLPIRPLTLLFKQ
jgi:hypothetical protein